jgi:hypothetical protein
VHSYFVAAAPFSAKRNKKKAKKELRRNSNAFGTFVSLFTVGGT